MAFMDQANKKRLAALAKGALAKWPGIKWTLAVQNHSTIVLTITESSLDFAANLAPAGNPHQESFRTRLVEREHLDVNHHSVERDFQGEARAFLLAARTALMTGNHNNSDAQADYYDVGWYVKIQIGRWNKPCRFTFERAPAPSDAAAVVEWNDADAVARRAANHICEFGDDGAPCYACSQGIRALAKSVELGLESNVVPLAPHRRAPAATNPDALVERCRDVADEMFGADDDGAAALPNEDVLAAMLAILANPESDQDQRDAVAERFERVGRSIETSSFREAGVMTDAAGFIIRFGGLAEFQVTVVRSR